MGESLEINLYAVITIETSLPPVPFCQAGLGPECSDEENPLCVEALSPQCIQSVISYSTELVDAVCYKSEGRLFDSWWGHWIFQLT
jgi:hypothetical protein